MTDARANVRVESLQMPTRMPLPTIGRKRVCADPAVFEPEPRGDPRLQASFDGSFQQGQLRQRLNSGSNSLVAQQNIPAQRNPLHDLSLCMAQNQQERALPSIHEYAQIANPYSVAALDAGHLPYSNQTFRFNEAARYGNTGMTQQDRFLSSYNYLADQRFAPRAAVVPICQPGAQNGIGGISNFIPEAFRDAAAFPEGAADFFAPAPPPPPPQPEQYDLTADDTVQYDQQTAYGDDDEQSNLMRFYNANDAAPPAAPITVPDDVPPVRTSASSQRINTDDSFEITEEVQDLDELAEEAQSCSLDDLYAEPTIWNKPKWDPPKLRTKSERPLPRPTHDSNGKPLPATDEPDRPDDEQLEEWMYEHPDQAEIDRHYRDYKDYRDTFIKNSREALLLEVGYNCLNNVSNYMTQDQGAQPIARPANVSPPRHASPFQRQTPEIVYQNFPMSGHGKPHDKWAGLYKLPTLPTLSKLSESTSAVEKAERLRVWLEELQDWWSGIEDGRIVHLACLSIAQVRHSNFLSSNEHPTMTWAVSGYESPADIKALDHVVTRLAAVVPIKVKTEWRNILRNEYGSRVPPHPLIRISALYYVVHTTFSYERVNDLAEHAQRLRQPIAELFEPSTNLWQTLQDWQEEILTLGQLQLDNPVSIAKVAVPAIWAHLVERLPANKFPTAAHRLQVLDEKLFVQDWHISPPRLWSALQNMKKILADKRHVPATLAPVGIKKSFEKGDKEGDYKPSKWRCLKHLLGICKEKGKCRHSHRNDAELPKNYEQILRDLCAKHDDATMPNLANLKVHASIDKKKSKHVCVRFLCGVCTLKEAECIFVHDWKAPRPNDFERLVKSTCEKAKIDATPILSRAEQVQPQSIVNHMGSFATAELEDMQEMTKLANLYMQSHLTTSPNFHQEAISLGPEGKQLYENAINGIFTSVVGQNMPVRILTDHGANGCVFSESDERVLWINEDPASIITVDTTAGPVRLKPGLVRLPIIREDADPSDASSWTPAPAAITTVKNLAICPLFWLAELSEVCGFIHGQFTIQCHDGSRLDLYEENNLYFLELTTCLKTSATVMPWESNEPKKINTTFDASQHRRRWQQLDFVGARKTDNQALCKLYSNMMTAKHYLGNMTRFPENSTRRAQIAAEQELSKVASVHGAFSQVFNSDDQPTCDTDVIMTACESELIAEGHRYAPVPAQAVSKTSSQQATAATTAHGDSICPPAMLPPVSDKTWSEDDTSSWFEPVTDDNDIFNTCTAKTCKSPVCQSAESCNPAGVSPIMFRDAQFDEAWKDLQPTVKDVPVNPLADVHDNRIKMPLSREQHIVLEPGCSMPDDSETIAAGHQAWLQRGFVEHLKGKANISEDEWNEPHWRFPTTMRAADIRCIRGIRCNIDDCQYSHDCRARLPINYQFLAIHLEHVCLVPQVFSEAQHDAALTPSDFGPPTKDFDPADNRQFVTPAARPSTEPPAARSSAEPPPRPRPTKRDDTAMLGVCRELQQVNQRIEQIRINIAKNDKDFDYLDARQQAADFSELIVKLGRISGASDDINNSTPLPKCDRDAPSMTQPVGTADHVQDSVEQECSGCDECSVTRDFEMPDGFSSFDQSSTFDLPSTPAPPGPRPFYPAGVLNLDIKVQGKIWWTHS